VWGAAQCWRRGGRDGLLWLSLLAGGWGAWALTGVLYGLGLARGSDEIYFFVLFAVAVQAGLGLHDLVRRAAALRVPPAFLPARVLAGPRGWAVAVLAAWLPFTLPWWWQPPLMDAHFSVALEPLPAEAVAIAEGLRRHTRGSEIVLAGEGVAGWIPALSGRRVLRVYLDTPGNPGYERERVMLVPDDVAAARAKLSELGVQVVVADPSLLREHGLTADDLARHPLLQPLFESADTRVYRVVGVESTRS
jgi:hypothetical protein